MLGTGGDAEAVVLADPEQHRVWRFALDTGDLEPIAGIGAPGFTQDNVLATNAGLSSPHVARPTRTRAGEGHTAEATSWSTPPRSTSDSHT